MKTILKKRTRLKNFSYIGINAYFVTICTHNKQQHFTRLETVEYLKKVLKERALDFGFTIWAYCFMPDHLHILTQGKHDNSDLKCFINSFKQITGYYFKKSNNKQLWQINYYDHILRKEENLIEVSKYILNNPIRKKLCNTITDYPYSGSFEFNLQNLQP